MSSDEMYSVRAKHQGEAWRHYRTRIEFDRCVITDSRTRTLFAFWGEQTGVDAIIGEISELLDAVARQAGLDSRTALRRQEFAYHMIPALGVLQRYEEQYERMLVRTEDARRQEAIGFVVAELFGTSVDEDVPIREWLANDLLTIFRWEVAARVYGDRVALTAGPPPNMATLPDRFRPRPSAALERDARWYYQTSVQRPRATWAELAEAYVNSRLREGVPIERFKDRDGRADRFNDSAVRRGAANAKRLLELTVPTGDWIHFLKSQA